MRCLLFGLGAMATLVLSIAMPVAARDVGNFTINSFDAEYRLSRDQEGRSVLKTTETITAVFPQHDQNHGIERALPEVYDSHTTRLAVDSVTDGQGKLLPYETYSSNDNTVLRIGDADTYVRGVQTYVVTYTQHDVTKSFNDTNADEFYWDVNGTGWGQTINSLQARLIIDPSLESMLNGNVACYQGRQGQTERCMQSGNVAQGMEFAASRPLQAGETMTLAVGFNPGTFTGYQQTWQEKALAIAFVVWGIALAIGSIAAVIAIIWMYVVRSKIMRRAGGGATITTEYLPPKNMSVLGSAQVVQSTAPSLTAQLLDLAVRHFIKIYQTKDKRLFQAAEYELEIVGNITRLTQEERRLLTDLYGKKPATGDRFAMKKLRSNYTISSKLTKSRTWLRDRLRGEYGIFEKAAAEAKTLNKVAVLFLVVGIITLSPLMIVAAIIGFWNAASLWPMTKKGAELHDYLEGLKQYITLAETERIKLLQSPEGAEKVGNIADDKSQLVKLYERVLPYAVLFGVEKEWMKQLGAYYEELAAQPDWYAGNAAFNAVVFSTALSGFSDQTSSYSSPDSSSSGGSGGSGFSGGGGGGGGGGGW